MKSRGIIAIIAAIMLAAFLAGCSSSEDVPQAAEDEIALQIQLDVKEDIGLLVIDADIDGAKTSGGISNADKSVLKHDELLYWSFNKQEYGNPADTVNLAIKFKVITEYCDPNYENIYPEELTVPLDEISFKADFGETYFVTITGDKESGYKAELQNTKK